MVRIIIIMVSEHIMYTYFFLPIQALTHIALGALTTTTFVVNTVIVAGYIVSHYLETASLEQFL